MSQEENKAIVRRIYDEVINGKNLEVIDELCSPDIIDHTAPPGTPKGIEGVKQSMGMFLTAFPDLHITIEDCIAEGDKVVTRYTFRGTHQGDLMGIAPTGKRVTVSGIAIDRVVDGKGLEHQEIFDQLAMMQQLGVIPQD
jgi:predicted ester cyclase